MLIGVDPDGRSVKPVKVRIQNFQSIEDVEMEIDGLTVVVGKSNIGKSALRRAIQGALTNLKGDYFVTHGKQYAQVRIQTPDIDLTWKKGGPFNDYEINGATYNNVGHGTPEAIADAGFRLLETNAGTIDVQIADQFRPLFLLQETGSLVAEAISDVGRLGDIQKALKTCEKDRRSIKAEKKIREGDFSEAKENLEGYASLEDSLKAADAVTDLLAKVQKAEKEVATLIQLQDQLARVEARLASLHPATEVDIPEILTPDLEQCKRLDTLLTRLQQTSKVYKALKGVDAIDVPDVDLSTGSLATLANINQRLQKVGPMYKGLRSIVDVDVPDVSLDDPLGKAKSLQMLNSRASVAAEKIPELQQDVSTMDAAIQDATDAVHQTLHEAGHCPTCEQVIP